MPTLGFDVPSLYSSIQGSIHALRKAHMHSIPPLKSFHNIAFGTVPMFV